MIRNDGDAATILRDASDEVLAEYVELNLFALFRSMAKHLREGEVEETGQLSRHFSFPNSPMFKGVWRSALDDETIEREIDETMAWFRARQAPFFFWWTTPRTMPQTLGDRLVARGMLSMEAQTAELAPGMIASSIGAPGMAIDLRNANEAVLHDMPETFEIRKAVDENDLLAFKKVFVASYEIPEWAGQAWVDATLAIGPDQAPWQVYVGWQEGEAVATTILYCGAGVASVYGVATIPSARGKGFGGAITLAPLLEARDFGYRFAVLFASEMGIHAYERIGFHHVPTRINRYLWRAP